MQPLTKADLMSLEQYAERRVAYRAEVMAHKQNRRVPLGDNASLYFEDRVTMQYQIQEVLRVEKIFEAADIAEELEAYNPLIPDGSNWKATFMLEYEDVEQRRVALGELLGVERTVWMRVGDCEKITPIANEDLERETEDKTSAVHFLRFELSPEMRAAAKSAAKIYVGVAHPKYQLEATELAPAVADSLRRDLS